MKLIEIKKNILLVGDWKSVGHATVSKFAEDGTTAGKWCCELYGDSSHLSDGTNLR
jgi:hypothetical protein